MPTATRQDKCHTLRLPVTSVYGQAHVELTNIPPEESLVQFSSHASDWKDGPAGDDKPWLHP